MTSFRLITEVSASPTFFGWVFGFGGKVQILAPQDVKEQYHKMIAQASEDTVTTVKSKSEPMVLTEKEHEMIRNGKIYSSSKGKK
jgi:hypothetical protein